MLDTAKLDALRRKVAENPGVVIEYAAKEHGVSALTVLEALPESMRAFAPGTAFLDAMADIATWGELTAIIHTEDGIFEIGGAIPPGSVSRGFFNLAGSAPFHGHLRHERCASVAFVERPFNGKLSVFVAFVNIEGGIMFKIFVGRDEKRELKQDQLVKFRALRERLGAK
jgi:putative heme utilization carrier protein HutX